MFSQTRSGRDAAPPSPNSEKLVLHCSRCRVCRVLAGQMNCKSRTLSKLRLHGYVAMVTLDDLLGHGEANAQAASFAGAAGIGAPKPPEDARRARLGAGRVGAREPFGVQLPRRSADVFEGGAGDRGAVLISRATYSRSRPRRHIGGKTAGRPSERKGAPQAKRNVTFF